MRKIIGCILLATLSTGFAISMNSSLIDAVEQKNLPKVESLVEKQHVWVNQTDKEGDSALMIAVQTGQLAVTQYLVKHGAEINQRNNKGVSTLMVAAQVGSMPILSYLLSQGGNIHLKDNQRSDALIFAAAAGHSEIALHLLGKKLDFNHCTVDGKNAYAMAKLNNQTDTVKALANYAKQHNLSLTHCTYDKYGKMIKDAQKK